MLRRKTLLIRQIAEQNSELQKQLSEIAKERALIDAITGSMNEGLLLLDVEGRILSANRSAQTILNISGDCSGKNILELVRNVDLIKHIETAESGTGSDATLNLSAKIYHAIFSPTTDGILVLLMDITEKFNAEKRRREFSANVSHELKTPLTTISGYAELLENGMMDTDHIPEAAGKIKLEASRLILLIEDIMRLSELDESETPIELTEFDLCETARNAAESLAQKANDANVTISTPKETAIINANQKMIFELFYNLIDNGIKYNKPGGRVDVTMIKGTNKVIITIADTGIGIEKKYLDRIFERFYRVDKSRSKKIDGTGLGLSIVKHIVACHHGVIKVESWVGKGTTIRIKL